MSEKNFNVESHMLSRYNNEYSLSGQHDDEHLITLKQNKTVLPVITSIYPIIFTISVCTQFQLSGIDRSWFYIVSYGNILRSYSNSLSIRKS